jgi:hypothetical protein
VLVALGGLLFALLGLTTPEVSLRSPTTILWRIDAPLLLALVSFGMVMLPGSTRLLLASTLLCAAGVETGARLLALREPRLETYVAPDYYQHDPLLGWAPLRAAVTPAWKRADGRLVYETEYRIDALGRRVTPLPGAGPRDRFLLFFGGSCAFGEGVGQEETLPFFSAAAAPRYEAYNYGFHGYGPQHLLARLEAGGLREEVSQEEGVLVYLFIDDHLRRAIGSMRVYAHWADDAPYYVLGSQGVPERRGTLTTGRPVLSLLYSLLGRSQALLSLGIDLPVRIEDAHVELTAALLTRSQQLYREQFGAARRFVVVASPGSRMATRLGAALGRRGVELLDYGELIELSRPEYHFAHDGHPTALTHRVVAERLVADLGLAAPVTARLEPRR